MKTKIFDYMIKYKAENRFEGVGVKDWIRKSTLIINLLFCPSK